MKGSRFFLSLILPLSVARAAPWQPPPLAPVFSSATYAGPGDTASFVAWWGLRAYNAAYATGSNPALQVCDTATGLTCSTINILSTGFIDRATALASSACAVQCGVASLTDQTGNGHTLTQSNRLLYPVVLFAGCPTTFQMCLQFTAANFQQMATASITQAQPFTLSVVAERWANTAAFNNVLGTAGGATQFGFSSAANNAYVWAGSNIRNVAATDSALHAMQAVFNGASSSICVDSTTPTSIATPGTTGIAAAMRLGDDANGDHPSIYWYEGGLSAGAMSSGNQGAVNDNQHGTSGWNF